MGDVEKVINEVEIRTTGVPPETAQHMNPVREPLTEQLNLNLPTADVNEIYDQIISRREQDRQYRDHRIRERGRKLIPGDRVYIS